MSFALSGTVITQTGTDLDLKRLAGSVTTDDFTITGGEPVVAVTIMGVETLASAITLTGNGSANINNLINSWNTANGGINPQIVRTSSAESGRQVLNSGQTITIPAGIVGVTAKREHGGVVTYQIESSLRLVVEGTLFHDPEFEILIMEHDWPSSGNNPGIHVIYSTNSWKDVTAATKNLDGRLVLTVNSHGYSVGDAVEYQVNEEGAESLNNVVFPILEATTNTITLGMTEYETYTPENTGSANRVTRRAVYHYGREKTDFGNTRLSAGCGLFFIGSGNGNYFENGAGLRVNADGLFRARGGVVFSTRPTALGNIDIDGLELITPNSLPVSDTRSMSGGAIKNLKLVNTQFSGMQSRRVLSSSFILDEGSLVETLAQDYYELVVRDLDTSNNIGENDIGHASNLEFRHRDWVIINSKTGSSVRGMYRTSVNFQGTSQMGVVVVKKEVSFNIKDSEGSPIEGTKMYLEDNPSAYAKNATFPVPTNLAHLYLYFVSYNKAVGNKILNIYGVNKDTTYNDITIQLDANIGSNVVVSFISGSLLIKYKSGATHANARDAINNNLSSDFFASTSGNANQALSALSVTSFGPAFSQFTENSKSLTEGVLNEDGTVTYDYTSPLIYSKSSSAIGEISTTEVTIGVQILEFTSDDPSASSQGGNEGPYDINLNGNDQWVDSSNNRPSNSSWDSDEFGGFYKVDRRGNDNSNEDNFSFNFCEYDKLLLTSTNSLQGLGELSVDIVLVQDLLITEEKTAADVYTIIENSEKFYNKAKAYLYDNFSGEVSTIVSRSGNTINAGSYNVVIDNSSMNAFSLSGNTITIKSPSFTGNIITSGIVTLIGSISYVGTITDVNGVRSFGAYEVNNLISGSRVQVYNTTTGTEIYNQIVNSTSFSEGFDTSIMNDGDDLRIRVVYQNGATAKEPQELLATCRYPSWGVTANQEDATQYNNYSVDGSIVSEFLLDLKFCSLFKESGETIDSEGGSFLELEACPTNAIIEVDISDADNATNIQRVGSWYYAELMTEDGIAYLFGAIDWIEANQIAIDQSKVDLKIDNIKQVPLILKGGRLYRLDGQTIIADNSNSIQVDYDPVYITNAPLIEKIDKNTKLIPALL